jgi:hypothetical protein
MFAADDSGPGRRAMMPRMRRQILDGMDEGAPEMPDQAVSKPLLGSEGPMSGNAGIGGGMAPKPMPTPAPMPPTPIQPRTLTGDIPVGEGMRPMDEAPESVAPTGGGRRLTSDQPFDGTMRPMMQEAPDMDRGAAMGGRLERDRPFDGTMRPMATSPAPLAPTGAAKPTAPTGYKRTAANKPAGVTTEKWLGGHVSPKYAWKEVAAKHNLKSTQGRQAALADLKTRYPQYFANASWENDKLRIGGQLHPQFDGISLFDVIKDEDGRAIPRWGTPEQDAKNRQIAATQGSGAKPGQRGVDPMQGSQRGMDTTQTSMIDQIRDTILRLMERQGAA